MESGWPRGFLWEYSPMAAIAFYPGQVAAPMDANNYWQLVATDNRKSIIDAPRLFQESVKALCQDLMLDAKFLHTSIPESSLHSCCIPSCTSCSKTPSKEDNPRDPQWGWDGIRSQDQSACVSSFLLSANCSSIYIYSGEYRNDGYLGFYALHGTHRPGIISSNKKSST